VKFCSYCSYILTSLTNVGVVSIYAKKSKSDAIQFVTGRERSVAVDKATVNVSGVAIQPAETIKSLGVVLDLLLSMDQHINNVCKACYFHIRALRQVRGSPPDDTAKTVAGRIVSSYSLTTVMRCRSSANYLKLQRVQNTLAHVVLIHGKHDHIIPALVQLHCMPIRQGVTCKTATLTFKVLRTHQPAYLYELIDN
jgi:hypothetical protein